MKRLAADETIVGDSFGRWEITEEIERNSQGNRVFVAACECGKTRKTLAGPWRRRTGFNADGCLGCTLRMKYRGQHEDEGSHVQRGTMSWCRAVIRANAREAKLGGYCESELTPEQLHALRERGPLACTFCGKPETATLHAEHDHRTGAFRGLTCAACNSWFQQFDDDPELLRKATAYLSGEYGKNLLDTL